MTDTVTFVVQSKAAPQGSKRHVGNGVMIESSKRVKPFRQDVRFTAIDAKPDDWDTSGAFKIFVDFLLSKTNVSHDEQRRAAKISSYVPNRTQHWRH